MAHLGREMLPRELTGAGQHWVALAAAEVRVDVPVSSHTSHPAQVGIPVALTNTSPLFCSDRGLGSLACTTPWW